MFKIRLATADVTLGIMENIQLELDTLATLIKLIYAFLWQEYVLTGSDIFLDPEVNVLGATFMSTVNNLANYLNSFPVLSEALQSGYGVYPGDTWCNPQVCQVQFSCNCLIVCLGASQQVARRECQWTDGPHDAC